MEFQYVFDIDRMGADLGGSYTEAEGPYGSRILRVSWTPELAEKLTQEIRRKLAGQTNVSVCHSGNAPMWVMGAALSAMYPAQITFTPPVPGVYLSLHNLKQGPLVPEAEVTFETRRVGDVLYVNYLADDPNKPMLYGGGHHSYNPELIPLIQAPEAGEDVHVCLMGNSSYNVTMSIATAYFQNCRSLSILGGGPNGPDPGYFCCYTATPERRIGDMTER